MGLEFDRIGVGEGILEAIGWSMLPDRAWFLGYDARAEVECGYDA